MDRHTENIRNIGLIGHSGAGKTTFSEALLYSSKSITRMGTVSDGNTISDYHPDEINRKMSIHSTVLNFIYNDMLFNIIDMPGYIDFMGDVKDAMHVCDMSILIIDAVDGPQIGSEKAWEFAEEYHQPRMICLNGLDKENSNFNSQIKKLKQRWGNHIVPLQIPIEEGSGFKSVIDLLSNKLLTWDANSQNSWQESDIPQNLLELAKKHRQELIEAVAEVNEKLMEKYFKDDTLSTDEIYNGLSKGLLAKSIYPVVCSSAINNIGINKIIELLEKLAPQPNSNNEIKNIENKAIDQKESAPASALIFKTMSEEHVGELSFFRVYSGTIHNGDTIKNTTHNINEKINQLFIMNGKNRQNVNELPAGSIGAVVKLKNTHTGDTLASTLLPIHFEKTHYPTQEIRYAMRPTSRSDEDKFSKALATIHEEDPTFTYAFDSETGETIVSGMGELHIKNIEERIKRQFKIVISTSSPKVHYRETIKKASEAQYRHKKQSGGSGQFAEVWLKITPLPRGSGLKFTESLVGQDVDRTFVSSVEKGINQISEEGIISGNKITDIKIDFYGGKMHSVDSNDIAFQLAARGALKEAFEKSTPCLLEPIYNVEIKLPEEFLGDVMGDISARRGHVLGIETEGSHQTIKALVPLMNLHKYSTALRSLTHGCAEHIESFSHYDDMPTNLMQKVIEDYREQNKK